MLAYFRGVYFLGEVNCATRNKGVLYNPSTPSAQDAHTYRKRSADIYVSSCAQTYNKQKEQIRRMKSLAYLLFFVGEVFTAVKVKLCYTQ